MYATPEEYTTTTKANFETSLALANAVFASVECLTALHLNTARTLFEDGLAGSKAFLGAKTLHDVAVLRIGMAQPVFEKTVCYSGSTYEIAFQSSEEVYKLITSQLSDMSTHAISSLQNAIKSTTANWEATSALFKAVVATGKPAHGRSTSKTTNKAVDLPDTVEAVATKAVAAPKARKAA